MAIKEKFGRCFILPVTDLGFSMERDNRNNGQLEGIGGIAQRVLKKYRRESVGELAGIWDLWESIVGGAVADNTMPAAFKGKLLIVHVSSSVWVHHLQFLKKDLINSINQALGKNLVNDIKFRIGPV